MNFFGSPSGKDLQFLKNLLKNAYSLVWQSAEGRADEKFGSVNRFRPFYSSSCEHSAWHSLDCPPCLCFNAGCGGQACTAGSILALELWAPGGRE